MPRSLVLVVLLLVALAAPAVTQPADDNLIVPGERIGKWTLAMTIPQLVEMNGRADVVSTDAADVLRTVAIYAWDSALLGAVTMDRQHVLALYAYGEHPFRTDRGIRRASGRALILALYGQPTAETTPKQDLARMIYDPAGIAFLVGPEGTLNITVFRLGEGRRVYRW